MTEITPVSTETVEGARHLSLLAHIREPKNLLTYLVFTAWCKFMGVSSLIPTITIG